MSRCMKAEWGDVRLHRHMTFAGRAAKMPDDYFAFCALSERHFGGGRAPRKKSGASKLEADLADGTSEKESQIWDTRRHYRLRGSHRSFAQMCAGTAAMTEPARTCRRRAMQDLQNRTLPHQPINPSTYPAPIHPIRLDPMRSTRTRPPPRTSPPAPLVTSTGQAETRPTCWLKRLLVVPKPAPC